MVVKYVSMSRSILLELCVYTFCFLVFTFFCTAAELYPEFEEISKQTKLYPNLVFDHLTEVRKVVVKQVTLLLFPLYDGKEN